MPTEHLRRPGSPWRLLVHEHVGNQPDGTCYSVSHDVSNKASWLSKDGEWSKGHLLEGTEFDELVVGKWATIHIEQLDTTLWWANFAGVTIHIRIDRDGRPQRVEVQGPHDYAGAIPGVEYAVTWSETCAGCGQTRCVCTDVHGVAAIRPTEDVQTGDLL